jgi:hypothetical protein
MSGFGSYLLAIIAILVLPHMMSEISKSLKLSISLNSEEAPL